MGKSKLITRKYHERRLREQADAHGEAVYHLERQLLKARGERDMPVLGDFGAAFYRIFEEYAVPEAARVFYLQPAACRAVTKAGRAAIRSVMDNDTIGLADFDDHSDVRLYGMSFCPLPGVPL